MRRTSERRLESGDSNAAHQDWYMGQMAQTEGRVVMETLAYLSQQDLSDALPRIQTPALVLASEQNARDNPDRTSGMVSPAAQGSPAGHPRDQRLRPTLRPGALCAGVAEVCGVFVEVKLPLTVERVG